MSNPVVQTEARICRVARERGLIRFFTIAFTFSWLVFLPMIPLQGPTKLTALASFGPTVAALATHRLAAGNYRAFRTYSTIYSTVPRTLAVTVFGVLLIVIAYVALSGITTADPHKLHWSILISGGVCNYSTVLGGPLGEEPGWRGYALRPLEAKIGPARVTAAFTALGCVAFTAVPDSRLDQFTALDLCPEIGWSVGNYDLLR